MIPFFRKARKKLADDNKPFKYMRYAIGEIVLVVIGILIALSINNWNENRKQNQSIKISIHSLKSDLKKDVIRLNNDIQKIRNDMDNLTNFKIRLSSPNATIDTLKLIARFEYLPFFGPSNELNRNTIVSLLSTGKIDNLNENLKSKILSHSSQQLRSIKIMDQNVSIFLNSQYAHGILMQSENPDPRMESVVIKGPLMEKYWKNKDENKFLDTMLSTLSGKMAMYIMILSEKEFLLENTNQLIVYLNDFENIK